MLLGLLGAIVASLLTTPLYRASTRLFVSTSTGGSLTDLYSGTLYSQERVTSYRQLITGETLAQRTIDKLDLGMSPGLLRGRVTATAKADTVLIDVSVLDESPVRARDIANTMSDEFVGLVRELETPSSGTAPDARVVVEQRATVPQKPVVPAKKRNIAVGVGLGLLIGVGLAFVRERLDNTVKDRESLEHITGVGLIGTIPFDKVRQNRPGSSFHGDRSAIAEAFRKLRTNLQFLAVDNPPRVIVVTGSAPTEGKSTTAINIAMALADAGKNVVLVDGDLRRPMLDQYLGLVGAAGLSTVLSGAALLSEVIQTTKFPRLALLASGATPPNPSELLGSQAAKRILAELGAHFDYVIVDSPPLLVVTDGAILAANSDGAVVVAQFERTKREQLAHSVGILQDVGASLLGVVLNMAPKRGSDTYYYTEYSQGIRGSADTPADGAAAGAEPGGSPERSEGSTLPKARDSGG